MQVCKQPIEHVKLTTDCFSNTYLNRQF